MGYVRAGWPRVRCYAPDSGEHGPQSREERLSTHACVGVTHVNKTFDSHSAIHPCTQVESRAC
jgi:hypothetical protein